MANTTFVAGTVITSDWLNDVNRLAYQEDLRSTNYASLQDAITAAAAAGLRLRVIGNYSQGTTPLTIPANSVIDWGTSTITWSGKPTAASGTFEGNTVYAAIEFLGDNIVMRGGTFVGPSTAAYVQNEACFFRSGTSSASRGTGIHLTDFNISNFGSYGVLTQYVDNIHISGKWKIDSVGYAGFLFSSCNYIRVKDGEIGNITPGTIGNCYGITLSHNSTNYSSDPNAGLKNATQPFCWDVVIDGITVYDIPLWQAIDAHGAYEVAVINCKTYNCRFGIAISGGSGAAANYAGWNNTVVNNIIQIKKRDGSATTVSATESVAKIGINISGGATTLNNGVVCTGNIIDGYGNTTATIGASILAQYVRNAQIANNIIKNWKGYGIYTAYGGGNCSDNLFDAVASATNATCLYFDTTLDSWEITLNKHRPLSGTVANEGLRNVSANPRCLIAGNDLESATTPYVNVTGANTYGNSDFTPQISVTNAPTSISVADAGRAPLVRIQLNPSGSHTVSDITGSFVGQHIELYAATTTQTTFDRTNAALAGGVNWVSTQYDNLRLRTVATSGTKFIEICRSANS